jgi:hypothetical protein
LNSVSFSYQCLKNEVCLYDIILLETIRIFAPLVFDELLNFKKFLFSNISGKESYSIRNEINETGKEFTGRINNYQNALPAIEGSINFMFPSNDIFNTGWDNYRNEKQEDLFKYQRVGVEKYFDRYVEFKIGPQDISDSEFKNILERLNTNDYSNLESEINRLCEFPKQPILTLFVNFRNQFTDLGKTNVSKILCTKEHFFKDTSLMGSMIHGPTRFALELIDKLDSQNKIDTVKYIIENCERINHTITIIRELQDGYGKEQELKFQPESEIESLTKHFVKKVQSIPIEKCFENVDDEKNNLLFHFIEKYGDLTKLKDDLLNFINIKPENGLIFIKSLIPMMFVNFSPIGEYPDDVDDSFLKRIEYYVPRERLLTISYQLYPEYKEKELEGYLRGQNMEKDKKIIINYLRFVNHQNLLTGTNGPIA